MNYLGWKVLSWEKSRLNLFKLQLRIFKSVLVSDIQKCFAIQKILLLSNSARLLSIKFSLNKNFRFITDGVNFSFYDKVNLNKLLLRKVFKWDFSSNLSTFSDLAWQQLVLFAICPSQESISDPLNFFFRSSKAINFMQSCLLLKLKNLVLLKYSGVVKVKLILDNTFLNLKFILTNLLASRDLKLCILRFLKVSSFSFSKKSEFSEISFSDLILNILMNKLIINFDYIQNSLLFLFLITPKDNQLQICYEIDKRLFSRGLFSYDKNVSFFSLYVGFDFMGWYFKFLRGNHILCLPSFAEYKFFLRRVKSIVNNSNYGAF